MAGLLSSSLYDITVTLIILDKKNTRLSSTKSFWTAPETPPTPQTPKIGQVINNTVEVQVPAIQVDSGPFSAAQIIVEQVNGKVDDSSCINQIDILDFFTAQEVGHSCYVAGTIDPEQLEGNVVNFVVGTGKYGNHPYYNALLRNGNMYNIWVSVVSTLDGVSKRASTQVPGRDGQSHTVAFAQEEAVIEKIKGANTYMVVAVVMLVLFLVILVAILGFIFYKRQKNKLNFGFKFPDILSYHRGRTLADMHTSNSDNYLVSSHQKMDFGISTLPQVRIGKNTDLGKRLRGNNYHHIESNPSVGSKINTKEQEQLRCQSKITSKISVQDMEHYLIQRDRSDYTLKEEYKRLPAGFTAPATVALEASNVFLNRSTQVLPFNDNRVQLTSGTWKFSSDYINASFVKPRSDRCYITTQAPLPTTVEHFWSMVWDYQVERIIMLMDLDEDGKMTSECYWPQKGNEVYGHFLIHLKLIEKRAHFTTRKLVIQLKGTEYCRTVHHYQFHSWLKGGVPVHVIPFLMFLQQTQKDASPGSMCAVHCHTGGGRSGTFLALSTLLEEGRATSKLDVLSCVTALRMERVNMVSTYSQYRFIHDCLIEAFSRQNQSIAREDFRVTYKELLHSTDKSGRTMLAHEFDELNSKPIVSKNIKAAGGDTNRFKSPSKTAMISTDGIDKSVLLKMTTVDSMLCSDAFIVAASPSRKEHIQQIWNMLYEQRINCIIMFGTWNEGVQYWPNDSMEETYGKYTVKNVSVTRDSTTYLSRVFLITSSDLPEKKPFKVRQIQFSQWPTHKSIPNVALLLDIHQVIFNLRGHTKHPTSIFLHCNDGITRYAYYTNMDL